MVGNFSPHEAFAIGGTNSVRGYEEGAVGSGRSYVVGCGEVSFPLVRILCLDHLFFSPPVFCYDFLSYDDSCHYMKIELVRK